MQGVVGFSTCNASAHALNAGAALRIPTLFTCNLHATGNECILSTSCEGLHLRPTPLLPRNPTCAAAARAGVTSFACGDKQALLHDLEVRGWRFGLVFSDIIRTMVTTWQSCKKWISKTT